MLIDMHVHSQASPGGKYDLATLCRTARERGLDAICVTDVHTVQPALEARARLESPPLPILVGFEACTDHGHFLVFVPRPERLPTLDNWLRFGTSKHASFSSLLEAVKANQGVLIAAHPYDRHKEVSPGDKLFSLPDLAAVEVLNGHCNNLYNEMAEEMAATLGLPGVGGSATLDDLEAMGRMATLVAWPVSDEASLIERLLAGDAWATLLTAPRKTPRTPHRRSRRRTRSKSKSPAQSRQAAQAPASKPESKRSAGKAAGRRRRRRRKSKTTNRG